MITHEFKHNMSARISKQTIILLPIITGPLQRKELFFISYHLHHESAEIRCPKANIGIMKWTKMAIVSQLHVDFLFDCFQRRGPLRPFSTNKEIKFNLAAFVLEIILESRATELGAIGVIIRQQVVLLQKMETVAGVSSCKCQFSYAFASILTQYKRYEEAKVGDYIKYIYHIYLLNF